MPDTGDGDDTENMDTMDDSTSCSPGQSTWLSFTNLAPGQACTLTLAPGFDSFLGVIADAPANLAWSRQSLTFVAANAGPVDFVMGADIFSGTLAFTADMPAGAALRIQILDASIEVGSGTHMLHFGATPPPSCSYCGCDASYLCPPMGDHPRQCCLYQGKFYCCVQPPY